MLLPSPVDLCTLYQAKSYVSADGTVVPGPDDDTIQRMISQVSRLFLNRTGNCTGPWQQARQSPFVQPVVATDTYDGNGTQEMYTRMFPIQSVQNLTISNVGVPASTGYSVYGYKVRDNGKSIVLMGGTNSRGYVGQFRVSAGGWPRFIPGVQNVVLAYTAGFPLNQVTNELQTIPAEGPFIITVDELPWIEDTGVLYFSDGTSLAAVTVAPAEGQYYVQSPGVYLFNAADAGLQVQISYAATGCPSDMAQAAIATVGYNYRKHTRQGMRSQQLAGATGGGMSTYSDLEIPTEALGTLMDYKRSAIVL